jgi:Ca-activated chloride channel homolog
MNAIDRLADGARELGLDFVAPFLVIACCLVLTMMFVAWIWKRTTRRVAVPYDHSSMPAGRGWWVSISTAETLLPLLAGVVLLILCNPLTTGTPIDRRSMTNIQFCVDSSGSMTARFGEGNRYDASMAAINQFLDYREGDAFGLTFFASSVVHWCPLTTDSSAFKCAIPFMKPNQQRAIGGGTRIGMALQACREVLNSREAGDKMIVLVSDGASADLYGGRAEKIAKQLSDEQIMIYAIHIGGGEPPPDILTLTTMTDGESFLPGDVDALDDVFRRIDQMRPAKIESVESEKIDSFAPWCLAGLVLLGCWTVSLFGLRYSPW